MDGSNEKIHLSYRRPRIKGFAPQRRLLHLGLGVGKSKNGQIGQILRLESLGRSFWECRSNYLAKTPFRSLSHFVGRGGGMHY